MRATDTVSRLKALAAALACALTIAVGCTGSPEAPDAGKNGAPAKREDPGGPGAPSLPPLPAPQVYGCDIPGGGSFAFTVRPADPADEVTVDLPPAVGNRKLVLSRVDSDPDLDPDSGATYEDREEGILYRSAEGRTRLDVDGTTYTCARQPPGELGFRGLGQEPGWILEIRPGDRIRFSWDYGQEEMATPVPEPQVEEGEPRRTVYRTTVDTHDLEVVVEHRRCRDVMSGRPFDAAVTVTLDGKTHRGCGELVVRR